MSATTRCALATLVLFLAAGAAAAGDAARQLEPGLHVEMPFGGATPAARPTPQLRARLDYRGGESALPAIVEWRLGSGTSEIAVAGLPLVQSATPGRAHHEEGSSKAERIVGMSVAGTVLIIGAGAWLFSEMIEDTGEAFGEGMSNGFDDGSWCGGIEIGDNCVGGSAEGG